MNKTFQTILAILSIYLAGPGPALAQDTPFTYQGQLVESGLNARGTYEFTFGLFDAAEGGTPIGEVITDAPVPVVAGLFRAELDFGFAAFNDGPRWLEISVRTNGSPSGFVKLEPRQRLSPAPFALHATLARGLSGNPILDGNVTVTGDLVANRLVVGAGNFLSGLNTTIAGGLDNTVSGPPDHPRVDYSIIAGGVSNSVNGGGSGTISGGSRNLIEGGFGRPRTDGAAIGGGMANTILESSSATIAGGSANSIEPGAQFSTIGGGQENEIGHCAWITIGGGFQNTNWGRFGTIAGGAFNQIIGDCDSGVSSSHGCIGGGFGNSIGFRTKDGTIGGGFENQITSFVQTGTIGGGANNVVAGDFGTVPGGQSNVAAGFSFAAGRRAGAVHEGSFVWADSTDDGFSTTANNQFLIRASGGVGIGTTNPLSTLHVDGAVTATAFRGSGALLTELSAGSLRGTISNSLTFAPASGAPFAVGNSNQIERLNADLLDGLDSGDFARAGHDHDSAYWKREGNAGTSPGTDALGTTDEQPLEFKVNEHRALRLEPTAGSPNIIGGFGGNTVALASTGTTIAGGGGSSAPNIVAADPALPPSDYATISGGAGNVATGRYATIPGGDSNCATNLSFAAGRRAKSLHTGSFVWGDSTEADVASTTNDQFTVRATGGVRFISDTNATSGIELAPGAGSWSTLSDRNSKRNFAAVHPGEILEHVMALPIQTWSYSSQGDAVRHIGPVAQDFHAAFSVGEDERHIATVDADGVALAAIQGLHQLLAAKEARITALEEKVRRVDALERDLTELKKLLSALLQTSPRQDR
jgi:hypothetical protein